MVHTLVPMSVKIKIKNFETPARLINHMELSCAVGMACREPGQPHNLIRIRIIMEGVYSDGNY